MLRLQENGTRVHHQESKERTDHFCPMLPRFPQLLQNRAMVTSAKEKTQTINYRINNFIPRTVTRKKHVGSKIRRYLYLSYRNFLTCECHVPIQNSSQHSVVHGPFSNAGNDKAGNNGVEKAVTVLHMHFFRFGC